eukprot:1744621-Karenia_brevis.AAC.1
MPLCALLQFLDTLLATTIHNFVDAQLPPLRGTYCGAAPHTTTSEIHLHSRLVIERGLDRQSAGTIAQADVATYYDSVPLLLIARWLTEK